MQGKGCALSTPPVLEVTCLLGGEQAGLGGDGIPTLPGSFKGGSTRQLFLIAVQSNAQRGAGYLSSRGKVLRKVGESGRYPTYARNHPILLSDVRNGSRFKAAM